MIFSFSDRLCLGLFARAFLGGLCFFDNLLGHLSRGILIPGKLKGKGASALSALTDKGSEIAHFRHGDVGFHDLHPVFARVHAQKRGRGRLLISPITSPMLASGTLAFKLADRLQQRGRRLGNPVFIGDGGRHLERHF